METINDLDEEKIETKDDYTLNMENEEIEEDDNKNPKIELN